LRNSTSQLAYFNLNETMNDNYIITQLEDNKYTFAIITDKPNNITVQTLYANQEFNVTDYNNNTQSYSYFDKISDNQGFIHFESEGGVHEIEIIKSASSRDPALSPPPTNGGGYAPKTYYSDEKLPIEGNNFNLRVWDKIRFVVQENNHTLTMMQFNSTSARAKIESEPITTWIEKDVFYEFDLNNDSVNDVRVRYDGMNQSKAMIFIQEIVYSDEEGEIVVEEIEEERNLSWLWVLIILVVLGFVGWVIYNKKRR